ncbi:MAG: hypothetical protein IPM06_18635 [Rhizobiales bacterium]|nr:hypothetical protein [Hyphomicrobiales bacterium]
MPLFSEAMGQQLADYGDLRGKRQEKGFNLAAQLEHMKRITAQVDEEIARQQELEASTQAAQAIPSMAAPDQVAPTPSIPAAIQFAMKSESPTIIPQNPIPGFSVPMPGAPAPMPGVSFSSAPKQPLITGEIGKRSVSNRGISSEGRNTAERTMFGLLSKAPERELDRNRMLLDRMTRERPDLIASMYDGDQEIAKGYDSEITRLQNSVTAGDAAKDKLYVAQLNASQRATGSYMSAEMAAERIVAAAANKAKDNESKMDLESFKQTFKSKQELAKNAAKAADRIIRQMRAKITDPETLQFATLEEQDRLRANDNYYSKRADALSTTIQNAVAGLFSRDKETEARSYQILTHLQSIGDAPVLPNESDKEKTWGDRVDEFGGGTQYKDRLKALENDAKEFKARTDSAGAVPVLPDQTSGPAPNGDIGAIRAKKERRSIAPPPPPAKPSVSAKEIEAAVRAEYAKLGADEATIQTAIKKRIAKARK